MTETRGFFYIASGEAYVAEAVASIARLRRSGNRQPVALCCDGAVAEGDADIVIPIETDTLARFVKVNNLPRTPFDRTVFLDTDTFVVGEIGDMFDVLDNYDLAAVNAAGYAGLPEDDVPAAFNELNTGVLAYRRSPAVMAFLAD